MPAADRKALSGCITGRKRTILKLKLREGLLDFDDLEIFAYRLLRGQESPDILYWLDRKVLHYLVDEFQDTKRHPVAVLDRLTEEIFSGQGAVKPCSRRSSWLATRNSPSTASARRTTGLSTRSARQWKRSPRARRRSDARPELSLRPGGHRRGERGLPRALAAGVSAPGSGPHRTPGNGHAHRGLPPAGPEDPDEGTVWRGRSEGSLRPGPPFMSRRARSGRNARPDTATAPSSSSPARD